jgi:hypothetical protein
MDLPTISGKTCDRSREEAIKREAASVKLSASVYRSCLVFRSSLLATLAITRKSLQQDQIKSGKHHPSAESVPPVAAAVCENPSPTRVSRSTNSSKLTGRGWPRFAVLLSTNTFIQ